MYRFYTYCRKPIHATKRLFILDAKVVQSAWKTTVSKAHSVPSRDPEDRDHSRSWLEALPRQVAAHR